MSAQHTPGPLVCWQRDGALKIVAQRTPEQQMLDVLVEVERCSDALLFRPDLVADIRATIARSAGPNWRAAIAKATGSAA
jgi:hypothetical protein